MIYIQRTVEASLPVVIHRAGHCNLNNTIASCKQLLNFQGALYPVRERTVHQKIFASIKL